MENTTKQSPKPMLEEARRRWGAARVLSGNPTPKQTTPTPTAPAVAAHARSAA